MEPTRVNKLLSVLQKNLAPWKAMALALFATTVAAQTVPERPRAVPTPAPSAAPVFVKPAPKVAKTVRAKEPETNDEKNHRLLRERADAGDADAALEMAYNKLVGRNPESKTGKTEDPALARPYLERAAASRPLAALVLQGLDYKAAKRARESAKQKQPSDAEHAALKVITALAQGGSVEAKLWLAYQQFDFDKRGEPMDRIIAAVTQPTPWQAYWQALIGPCSKPNAAQLGLCMAALAPLTASVKDAKALLGYLHLTQATTAKQTENALDFFKELGYYSEFNKPRVFIEKVNTLAQAQRTKTPEQDKKTNTDIDRLINGQGFTFDMRGEASRDLPSTNPCNLPWAENTSSYVSRMTFGSTMLFSTIAWPNLVKPSSDEQTRLATACNDKAQTGDKSAALWVYLLAMGNWEGSASQKSGSSDRSEVAFTWALAAANTEPYADWLLIDADHRAATTTYLPERLQALARISQRNSRFAPYAPYLEYRMRSGNLDAATAARLGQQARMYFSRNADDANALLLAKLMTSRLIAENEPGERAKLAAFALGVQDAGGQWKLEPALATFRKPARDVSSLNKHDSLERRLLAASICRSFEAGHWHCSESY